MKFLTWRTMTRRRKTRSSAVRAKLRFPHLKSSVKGDTNRTLQPLRGKGSRETTVNKVEQQPRVFL